MDKKKKLVRVSTIPASLDTFCRGQLKMLNDYFDVIAVSSPGAKLQTIEQREGVRVVSVRMCRHISILKDIISLFRMIVFFYKERPHIVHSITPKAGLISMLAAWICRVPIRMHTYTGLVFPSSHGFKQWILIIMDKILCACATYINPEGEGVAYDLKRFGITKKPLHIIGNGNVRGIDAEYWKPLTVVNKKNNSIFTFIFVGRLVGDKGVNELVKAFSRLEKARLILVGHMEESLDPLKESTINEIFNNPNIRWVGSQNDVRPFYAQADAFVLPSYREGFPNTVLEAGAMGLPSIVTDINGSNEIIIPSKNGVIVPSKDVESLYQAMKFFMDNTEEVKCMASNARRLIIDRYEQHYIWSELLRVYESLCS